MKSYNDAFHFSLKVKDKKIKLKSKVKIILFQKY